MPPASPAARLPAIPTSQEITRRLLDAAGDRLVAVILHGSRAKGLARDRSDWDVVVVLRDPVEDWIEEALKLSALFYDGPFAVDIQAFAECEFRADATVPGTLAYAVSRRGEYLYDTSRDTPNRGGARVGPVGSR